MNFRLGGDGNFGEVVHRDDVVWFYVAFVKFPVVKWDVFVGVSGYGSQFFQLRLF